MPSPQKKGEKKRTKATFKGKGFSIQFQVTADHCREITQKLEVTSHIHSQEYRKNEMHAHLYTDTKSRTKSHGVPLSRMGRSTDLIQ